MNCKFCGKLSENGTDVCSECDRKLARGENPCSASAETAYRDPVAQLKEISKNDSVKDPSPDKPNKPDSFFLNEDKSKFTARPVREKSRPFYTYRSGLVFGILSVVLSIFGLIVSVMSLISIVNSRGFDNYASGIVVWHILMLTPFIAALVLGIIAIKTFKDANRYLVKPVATLVLGIIGVANAGNIFLVLLETLAFLLY